MTTNAVESVEVPPAPTEWRDMAGDGVHTKVYEMTKYLVKGRDICVVGAGEGAFENRLMQNGIPASSIKSVDIAPHKHQARDVECVFGDLNERIPFPDQSFTFVYAIEVIEHLQQPKRLIEEAFRVLKPGSFLCISTPNAESLQQRLRYLLTGRFSWFSEEDYTGSGHIYPIFDWVLERNYRGMFERLQYGSQSFQFRLPGLPAIPMWKSKTWAVNNIYVLRRLSHPASEPQG